MIILTQESKDFYGQEFDAKAAESGWKFTSHARARRIYISLRAKHRADSEASFVIAVNGDAEYGAENCTNKALQVS